MPLKLDQNCDVIENWNSFCIVTHSGYESEKDTAWLQNTTMMDSDGPSTGVMFTEVL